MLAGDGRSQSRVCARTVQKLHGSRNVSANGEPVPDELTSGTEPSLDDVILVVDDEPSVLSLVVRLLEMAGHRAIACQSPGTALSSVEQYRVCAVISDISMPEMSGFTLAQQLHAEKPELPVVLMTGGQADPEIAQIAMDFGACAFLQKPFEANQLWSAVERALESGLVAARKRAV